MSVKKVNIVVDGKKYNVPFHVKQEIERTLSSQPYVILENPANTSKAKPLNVKITFDKGNLFSAEGFPPESNIEIINIKGGKVVGASNHKIS